MEKPITLDATQHAVSALQGFESFRISNELCDFTVKVGKDEILVHKVVLATRSEYFRAMFQHDTKETNSGHVVLKDTDPDSVKKCIDYIYTGKASVTEENIGHLMHVAHLMRLEELCHGIVELLKTCLNSQSFFRTKNLANMYSCKDLEERCDKFALDNFGSISKLQEFNLLERKYVSFLISSGETKASEQVKFEALISWINHDLANRRNCFLVMLEDIKLSEIPLRFHHHLVENEPLVFDSSVVLKHFMLAILNAEKVKSDAMVVFDKASNSMMAYTPTNSTGQVQLRQEKLQDLKPEMKQRTFTTVVYGNYMFALMSDQAVYKLDHTDVKATWNKVTTMQTNYGAYPDAAVIGDFIYVIGPRGGERYNILEGKWEAITARNQINYAQHLGRFNYRINQPQQRIDSSQYTVIAAGGFIYVIGGMVRLRQNNGQMGDQAHNFVERYDPKSSHWTNVNSMRSNRYNAAAVAMNGNIYVLGGFYGQNNAQNIAQNIPQNAAEYFSPTNGTWVSITNMITPRGCFSACVVNGKLYAVGGDRTGNGTVEVFNAETNSWQTAHTFTHGIDAKSTTCAKILA